MSANLAINPANPAASLAANRDNYPALAEMGIVRFHEISHYSLRQDGEDKDILRVFYKRAKGSLLPYSRKYRFGRSMKTVVADGGTNRYASSHEISPFLLKAVAELDSLVAGNQLNGNVVALDQKAALIDELNQLQSLLSSSAKGSDVVAGKLGLTSAVDRHLAELRKQIEAL